MIFELWSRRAKRTKWVSLNTFLQTLPEAERESIKAGARAILGKQRHRVRAMIWTRTSPYWRPRFFRKRKASRLRRCARMRLLQAAEWRKYPKRRPTRLLRSKGWGRRACPHLFGRDCLNSWKNWLMGDGVQIVTSLAGANNGLHGGKEPR